MILAILLSALLFVATLTAHRLVTRGLVRFGQGRGTARFALIVFALLIAHLAEVGLFAGGYELGRALGLGGFREPDGAAFMDVYYFSLATYATLGLGKVMPMGHLAFVAGVEAFCGFLAITMSATALFQVTQDDD